MNMPFQLGSGFFFIPPQDLPTTVVTANNGTSMSGTTVVLGNDVGGTASQLLSDREIPTAGFTTSFSGAGRVVIGSTTPVADLTIDRFSVLGNATMEIRGTSSTVTIAGYAGVSLLTFISSAYSEIRTPAINMFITNPSAMAAVGNYTWLTFSNPNHNQQVGTGNGVLSAQRFAPAAGNAVWNGWHLNDAIDQTAGGTGITRQLLMNPQLTGTPADFRTLEIATTQGRTVYQTGAAAINSFMGFTGFGEPTPVARVHIGAGTTAIGQLFMANGVLVTVPVNNLVENDGSFLYYTTGGIRSRITTQAMPLSNDRVIYSTGGRISESANFQFSNTNVSVSIGGVANNANCFLILSAGTNAKAPFRFTAGPLTAVVVDGNVEFDGTNYFVSAAGARYTLLKAITGTAVLDFPNTAAGAVSELTTPVTGLAVGDTVIVQPPNGSVPPSPNSGWYTGYCAVAGTLTVRFSNNNLVAAYDPASGSFRYTILKF